MSKFEIIPHEFDRIVHLHFETQYHLTSAFVRMQEFYESPFPEIRGQVFTLIEFMDRYADSNKSKKFTYFTDWAGFNIPGNVLSDFFDRFYDEGLSSKESAIWNTVGRFHDAGDRDYYIIGTYGDATGYVEHELAHAYYYLNPVYRKFCDEIYAGLDPEVKAKVAVGLLEMGYTEEVIGDETQAYFATDAEDILRKRFGLEDADITSARDRYIKNLQTVRTWKKSPF